MDSSQFVVSAEALNRLVVAVVAVPVCLFAFRRMLPRFSSSFKFLASALLLAQVLTFGVALGLFPVDSKAVWLWDVNREFNISSTLASVQLALVGGLALGSAWLLRARLPWHSLYLAVVGLVFFYLALDEYYALHERMDTWKRYYAAVGALLSLMAIALALRTPRRHKLWYFCFPAGLAIAGAAATLLEFFPGGCGELGAWRLEGCLRISLWEEAAEFLGIWLALLAMLGIFTGAMPAPKPRIRQLPFVLLGVWLLLLYFNSLAPKLDFQRAAEPADIAYERGVRLRGYAIDSGGAEVIHVRLFITAKRGVHSELGYTLSLVDVPSGETVASRRMRSIPHNRFWMLPPGASILYPQSLALDMPTAAQPRDLAVVLALWHGDGDQPMMLPVLASDREMLDDSRVILGELG